MNPSFQRTARLGDGPAEVPFRQVLDQVERLPTLPEVISKIMSLVDDPRISAQRIGDVVGQDQSMVATILKVVNSPFYGLSSRVISIQHAVVLLGFRSIRNMALSAVLVRTFGESSRDHRFDRSLLWRHTVATAVGARLLADMMKSCDPEEAFLAGLMHDMGIVILDQYFHDGFREVLSRVLSEGEGACDAERAVFGHDHAAVGSLLAGKWNFPPPVVEAIACHHDPIQAHREPVLSALVHVADYLSRAMDRPAPDAGEETGGEGAGDDLASAASEGTDALSRQTEPRQPQVWEMELLDPAALETGKIGPEELSQFRRLFPGEWTRAQIFLSPNS